MSPTLKNFVAATGAGLLLSAAAMVGTTATAVASPVSSPAASSTVQSNHPPHWCAGGKHWRARWFDNRGYWDNHHKWQRGRWNNDGCY